MCFFFFQAEDGIRDKLVTGVQTCAIPICGAVLAPHPEEVLEAARRHEDHPGAAPLEQGVGGDRGAVDEHVDRPALAAQRVHRAEQPGRRVVRRAHDLAHGDRPVVPEPYEVGERPADVHADPLHQAPPSRLRSSTAPASASVPTTAARPTQSPSPTYSVVTSVVTSLLATTATSSRRVASCTPPRGSIVSVMPEFAARAMPIRVSMARITRCVAC